MKKVFCLFVFFNIQTATLILILGKMIFLIWKTTRSLIEAVWKICNKYEIEASQFVMFVDSSMALHHQDGREKDYKPNSVDFFFFFFFIQIIIICFLMNWCVTFEYPKIFSHSCFICKLNIVPITNECHFI